MTDSGKIICNMGLELKHGLMEINMKDNIFRDKNKGLEHISGTMEVFTLDIGKRENWAVKANINGQTGIAMKGAGKITWNTDKEKW